MRLACMPPVGGEWRVVSSGAFGSGLAVDRWGGGLSRCECSVEDSSEVIVVLAFWAAAVCMWLGWFPALVWV